ncbi:hypothetical protein I7I51_05142 [Histoplasma capsulatum]|uniref:Uncharacterized protein n=1 Tax=Ajellomyces capsulatus TaxID=5037 RepID=A0A8A1M6T3_AJECA|nr:hypothetical protein I7I51_05142 [Histoplasma capsulatum]
MRKSDGVTKRGMVTRIPWISKGHNHVKIGRSQIRKSLWLVGDPYLFCPIAIYY